MAQRSYHLGYRFVVPLPERLAGITYVGHAARLRLVLQRARNGERLRVGALGGSITAGQAVGGREGSYVKTFMDWLNAALPPGDAPPPPLPATATAPTEGKGAVAAAAAGGNPRFRRRAGEVVQPPGSSGSAAAAAAAAAPAVPLPGASAPVAAAAAAAAAAQGGAAAASGASAGAASGRSLAVPAVRFRSRHECLNGAVPGTQSSYMSSCLNHHLPPGVDLVLVEYAANDSPVPKWTFADPGRRALERLIRKLLRLPSKPAVVLVNMFAIAAAHGNYLHSAERDFSELATYYGLPSVSLKAAVMPSAAVGAAEQVAHGAIFNGGLNHPGRGGHVVVSELLITMCMDLLRSNGNGAACDPWVGGGGAAAAAAAALAAAAERPLPPPLAEDNYESSSSTCYIEHELRGLVQKPVEGWEWTDEGRGKWGFVALQPSRTLRIKVDSQLAGNRSAERANATIVVQIAYLQSYLGMGLVRLHCVSGCVCKPVTIDAYDRRPVSVTSMQDIQVSQHPECVLTLTTKGPSQAAIEAARKQTTINSTSNSNSTSSGGAGGGGGAVVVGAAAAAEWSKFKLLGVVVGEEPGASSGGVTWVRDESLKMAHEMQRMRGGAGGGRRRGRGSRRL
ncbi:hypothetical protein PLESTM_001747400 [Pleodorina starrii]|nr:hypothetical protein PLESTM_001747400 [Pleodorina starrii]